MPNGSTNALSGPCYQILANPSQFLPDSTARQNLVLNGVLAASYNTNYTASWILVRSGPVLDANGNASEPAASACVPAANTSFAPYLDRTSTIGPLRSAMFDGGQVPSNTIPLLGCGGPAAGKTLPTQLGSIPQGAGMAASFTGGPMQNNGLSTMSPPAFPVGTPHDGAAGWWNSWAGGWTMPSSGQNPPPGSNLMPPLILQDYRQFSPVHRGYCNIVFADGSVRTFQDFNNDQQLNDGFPGSYNPPAANGFIDNNVEIGPSDVFSAGTLQGL